MDTLFVSQKLVVFLFSYILFNLFHVKEKNVVKK